MRLIKTLITAATAFVLVMSLTGCQFVTQVTQDGIDQANQLGLSENPAPVQPDAAVALVATLIRVVDGDTITVVPDANFPATSDSGSEHTIRMLGIDTPEMNKMSDKNPECGATEAGNYLGDLLTANAGNVQILVIFDARADHTDRFGRSLAYIELNDATHTDVNLTMVADGFAEAWYPKGEPEPERFSSYRDAQEGAVAANAGQHAFCAKIGR